MTTRTALLDAAEFAARSRGFDAFSYADLSRSVGIRKASIHHHFPAKSDLALAIIARYRAQFAANLAAIDAQHATAAARLAAFVQVYRNALSNGETLCLCVAFSAGRDSFQAPVLAELYDFHADCLSWLEKTFLLAATDQTVSGANAADAEAAACLALVEGAQLLARAGKEPKRFDAATAQFISRLADT